MPLSRRQLLIGGGASIVVVGAGTAGLVDANVLPGKQRVWRAIGGCGPGGVLPDVVPGPVATGSFRSAARGGVDTSFAVLYPPGSDTNAALPVCIGLHGRGGSHTWVVQGVSLDRYLADYTAHGGAPFAIASVDGGDSTNWHRRADGEDPLAMVRDELMPRLADRGLRVARYSLWGWSLGGYGALRLAALAGPTKVAAVVASSPALWTSYRDAADGVFDGAADFAANDVMTMQGKLAGIPLRIDCGSADPFSGAVNDFRASLLPTPAGEVAAGCHDSEYWTRVAPDELAFIGSHLTAA